MRAGQPLASIYSQELLSSQSEYLTLRQNQAPAGDKNPLLQASRTRLKLFGMNDSEIATLERRGEVLRNVTLLSPRDGIVVYTGKIATLRRIKDDVKEVTNGFECGVMIAGYNDLKVGDVIETYEVIEEAATL